MYVLHEVTFSCLQLKVKHSLLEKKNIFILFTKDLLVTVRDNLECTNVK